MNDESDLDITPSSSKTAEENLGDYLRGNREKKRIKLQHISLQTKINHTILEQLEKNDVHNLPGKTYVRGFVRTYCKMLDIDPDLGVQYLNQLYGITTNIEPTPLDDVRGKAPGKSISFLLLDHKKENLIFLSLVVIVAIAVLGYNKFQTTRQKVDSHIKVKSEVLSAQTPLKSTPSIVDSIKITQTKKMAIQSVVKEERKQEQKQEQEREQEQEKKPEITLRPIKLPMYTFHPKNDFEKLPKKIRSSFSDERETIYLIAEQSDLWLTYKRDDQEIKKVLIKMGGNLLITGQEIRLLLGNVNGAKIYYQRHLLSFNSRSSVKNVVFPVASANNFRIPLFIFDKRAGSVSTSEHLQQE
ncbi:MAG: hypothetical protein HN353_02060 [Bdellovibrionales bacterium]|jgi:cytoskeleton protein RodZ|nr:hypothetical protein [Bdellovibrionales bacterium]MBT3525003.1 hypothetical protein [Bdellovibrionales bacterium]MBT7670080.1 hypothetical protein [Bdellovibrionales bacterium]